VSVCSVERGREGGGDPKEHKDNQEVERNAEKVHDG
jgi:hypothetical protein